MECLQVPLHTPSSPDRPRFVPLALNYTRLPCPKPNQEPVRRLLPTNYGTSLYRLRTQMRRLEKDPDILKEYGNIIEEQLQAGVIEKVAELENAPRVHYLLHQAIVRKESATTKVRVLYDASSKESKGCCMFE